ncbi:MAG TPA: ABC transporter permease [Candidatus Aquilonibacter sp.]|nr:ABC transporter permease [Candidatus Aquilonibacter sp.]
MHKTWLIIKREYVTAVKNKGFVIGTVMVPLIGIVIVLMIGFFARHQSDKALRIAILDNGGGMAETTARGLRAVVPNGKAMFAVEESIEKPASPDAVERDLRAKVNSGALDAYLVIPSDPDGSFELHARNTGNFGILAPLSGALNQAVMQARLRARGIQVNDLEQLSRGARLEVIKVSESGESVERGQTIGVGVGVVILLYMSLLMYGILTMRSVLEEKTTRTMEVLVSSVQPYQLLAGKIIGVAGVAFTQFFIWIASLGLLLTYGAVMGAAMGGSSLPSVHIPLSMIIWTAFFFFGGYFLYSSMFAAIGAACSSEQDAGQLQWLAMGPLVFTMCVYWVVLTNPASTSSIVLSEIPFLSPVLMPLRISIQSPPAWQMVLSVVLLFATILGAIWASAKVYRIGVLMYGKRPTVPELVRWLRYT